jgi:O-antigen ligase
MLLSLELFLIIAGIVLRLLVSGATAGAGLNMLVGLLIWLALLLDLVRKNDFTAETQRTQRPILWLTVAWGCLIVWGFLIAPYKFGAFPYAFAWLTDIILFYLVIKLDRPYLFLGAFAGTAVIISCYALYQHLWGLEAVNQAIQQSPRLLDFIPVEMRNNFWERLRSYEPFGTFTYQNSLGGFLVLIIPAILSLALISKGQKTLRILCVLGALVVNCLVLYVLWSTGSKGAWVAATVGLTLFGILSYVPASRRRVSLIIWAICVIGVLIYFALQQPPSLTVRYGYWQGAWEIIKHHPLGAGINQFADYYLMYRGAGAEVAQKAHNDFLQIGAELGVIGLIAFIAIFAYALFKGLKYILADNDDLRRRVVLTGLVCGLAGFLLHCAEDFNFYNQGLSMSAWLAAACVISLSRSGTEEKTPDKGLPASGGAKGDQGLWRSITAVILLSVVVFLSWFVCQPLLKYDALLEAGQSRIRSVIKAEEQAGLLNIEEAIRLNPYAVEPYLELAFWYHDRKSCPPGQAVRTGISPGRPKHPDCIELMAKAIALSPLSARLYEYQAGFYQEHNLPDKYDACLMKAKELNPHGYK